MSSRGEPTAALAVRRRVLATPLIALVLAWLPMESQAAGPDCTSSELASKDARQLARVARKTAGSLRLIKTSLSACVDPGHASARYDAQPVMLKDGSVVHPHVACRRDAGPWACKVEQERTAKFDVGTEGARRIYEFEMPSWLELDDARRLVNRAFELGPTLSGAQQCGVQADPKSPDHEKEQAPDFAALDFLGPKAGSIAEEQYGVAVRIADHVMRFVLTPDHNAWRFVCWETGAGGPAR